MDKTKQGTLSSSTNNMKKDATNTRSTDSQQHLDNKTKSKEKMVDNTNDVSATNANANGVGSPTAHHMFSQVSRITNFPISIIIEDKLAFSSFIAFCKDSHTSENVFFWSAAVAFREIGNSEGWERGLARTPSWTIQEQMDVKESQRRGANISQVKALRESLAIYDRFIAPEAPNWVCVPLDIVKRIEVTLDSARLAKKDKMPTLPYSIFQEAERYAFLDMIHDILPRYLKQLAKDNDIEMMDYLKNKVKEKFGDAAYKVTPAEQANEMTKPETIANALSALHPTPRACLNNRPGSCLKEPIPIKSKNGISTSGTSLAAPPSPVPSDIADTRPRSGTRIGLSSIKNLFSKSGSMSEEGKGQSSSERRLSTSKTKSGKDYFRGSIYENLKIGISEDGDANGANRPRTRSKSG